MTADRPGDSGPNSSASQASTFVIQGAKYDRSRAATWMLPQLVALPVASILLETTSIFDAALPWTTRYAPWAALAGCMLGAPLLLSLADWWWRLPLTGTAELGLDGIRIARADQEAVLLPWSEIAGFASTQAAYVQLYRAGSSRPSRAWTVPTPDERTRVKLLEILDSHGIPQR